MKRKLVILLTMVLTFSFVRMSHAELRLSVRLLGGMEYLSPGDVNQGTKGWDEYFSVLYIRYGYSLDGETKPVHLGYGLGGDIVVHFAPQIGIGVGTGYIQGSNLSERNLLSPSNEEVEIFTNKRKISAFPIKLGLFFNLPLNKALNITSNIGCGFYSAKYSHNFRTDEDGYWMEWNTKANANGLGFHGGIGFEYNLASNIAFVLEGQGRYAKIGGFEGTVHIGYSVGGGGSEEGKLYYISEGGSERPYPIVMLREVEASDLAELWGVSEVREAKVDFSGFALLAGIKIKF